MATNALLDDGDELLVPAPDYPLWTAAASLSGGRPVHYLCDEDNGWMPSLTDIRAKITPRTRGIVVINPNNPTGALYSDELLKGIVQIAREHNLVLFADEVYDKVLYDGVKHTAMASLSTDVVTLTFNSLSKAYRSCGYRAGWMVISGDKTAARDYIEGINMLANIKLGSNVPGQWAIQTALGGYQSINDLVKPGGRLCRQRDLAYELITAIPGVTCVKPQRRCTCSPAWTPRCTPSRTTASSLWKCCAPRGSCWCRDRASITPTTSTFASCSCRTKTTCARPSAGWRASWPPTGSATPRRRELHF